MYCTPNISISQNRYSKKDLSSVGKWNGKEYDISAERDMREVEIGEIFDYRLNALSSSSETSTV